MSRRRTSNCSVRLPVSRESPVSNNCSSTVRSCSSAHRFTACSACPRKKYRHHKRLSSNHPSPFESLYLYYTQGWGQPQSDSFAFRALKTTFRTFLRFYESFVVQYCGYRIKRKHLILALASFGQHKTPYENEAPVETGTPRFCLRVPICTNRNAATGSLGFYTYRPAFSPPSIPLFPTFRLCFQTY